MKIVFASDFHLGFDFKGLRSKESFENALQVLEKSIQLNADLVVLTGDLFDESLPNQEVMVEAIKLFSKAKHDSLNKFDAKIKVFSDVEKFNVINFNSLPILAIHGTHEYRGKNFKNALQVLEAAKLLCYQHAGPALIEKNNEKICFYCFGGVPEKKAKDVLTYLQPKPLPNSKNVLLMHQSFKEFLPFDDDEMVASLSLSDLPANFDLTVNGHLHWNKKLDLEKSIFLLPGSTIITQMKKLESECKKGFFVWDSIENSFSFVELDNQRRFFYHKLNVNHITPADLLNEVRKTISECLAKNSSQLIPLIRIKVNGSLASGFNSTDFSFSEIEKEFSNKAVLSLSKNFESVSLKDRIEILREKHKNFSSIKELGMQLLEKNLNEAKFDSAFDFEQFFQLLEASEPEKALELILQKK